MGLVMQNWGGYNLMGMVVRSDCSPSSWMLKRIRGRKSLVKLSRLEAAGCIARNAPGFYFLEVLLIMVLAEHSYEMKVLVGAP